MITDTEIKQKGIQILAEYLGDVEAERFIDFQTADLESQAQDGKYEKKNSYVLE